MRKLDLDVLCPACGHVVQQGLKPRGGYTNEGSGEFVVAPHCFEYGNSCRGSGMSVPASAGFCDAAGQRPKPLSCWRKILVAIFG